MDPGTRPSPLKVELPAGLHAICRCGKTDTPPFCDGHHRGTAVTPLVLEVAEPMRYAWCVCRHSGRLPACDGTHKTLPESPSGPASRG